MGPTLDVHNSSGGFRSSIKASARLITNSVSTAKQDDLYEYPLNENTLSPFSPNRSSTSSRSSRRTSYFSRREASSSASLSHESDVSGSPLGPRYHILASTACPVLKTRTLETSSPYPSRPFTASAPFPHADLNCSSGSFIMATAPYVNDSRPSTGKLGTSQSNTAFGHGGNGVSLPPPGTTHNPHTVYQHIQNTASKRISTLDYLRKAHEGRVYWFNTLLFSKSDLARMPFFDARKLARRATNYLILGLSLPSILDLNASGPLEYLRALNALLIEFESYQQIHSPDGPSSSSLSRARIPQMFKRAAHGAGTKGRRTSSAADIGLPLSSSDPADVRSITNNVASAGSSVVNFPISEQELLPGEEYTHLLTPSLPFDPDFFEIFATLCDVLIDCYTRIIGLLPSPAMCAPNIGEMFAKADTRLRKVIVQGIVKDFEDASRSGAKSELTGVNKVVLGGLA